MCYCFEYCASILIFLDFLKAKALSFYNQRNSEMYKLFLEEVTTTWTIESIIHRLFETRQP